MKAVRFHEHGGPDKLVFEEVDDPRPGPDEALLAVKACAVNRLDLWVRQGIPAYPVVMPHILGSDIAGVVLEGSGLPSGMNLGDSVIVYPGKFNPHSPAATKGLENHDDDFKIIGGHIPGGYAEKVIVPSRNLIPKPENLNWTEAAAYPLTFLTAWHMLATRAHLTKGDEVLIQGASAGIGVAAIQIASYLGARVIAATTHPEKAERLKALGADEVLSGHPTELGSKVHELTKGLGVDVVFEHVGPATWESSLKSARKGGRIVTCGATTGPEVNLILRQLFSREISVLGSTLGTVDELVKITKLIANGKFKPVVDTVYKLQDAAEAHRAMLRQERVGKLVLEVSK